jgi:hypothetical protein
MHGSVLCLEAPETLGKADAGGAVNGLPLRASPRVLDLLSKRLRALKVLEGCVSFKVVQQVDMCF